MNIGEQFGVIQHLNEVAQHNHCTERGRAYARVTRGLQCKAAHLNVSF